jgi:hypothetical protein
MSTTTRVAGVACIGIATRVAARALGSLCGRLRLFCAAPAVIGHVRWDDGWLVASGAKLATTLRRWPAT